MATVRFGNATGVTIDYAGTQDTAINSAFVNYNYGLATTLP